MKLKHTALSIGLLVAATLSIGVAQAQTPQANDPATAPSLPETQARQGETTGARLSRTDGVIKPPSNGFPQPQADVPAPPSDIVPARPGDQQKPQPK